MTSHSTHCAPSRVPRIMPVIWALTLGVIIFIVPPARAQSPVPMQVYHEGQLFELSGAPLVGLHQLHYTLYDRAGTVLWSETIEAEFYEGTYRVVLGASQNNPLDIGILSQDGLLIGMAVDDQPEFSPKLEILSVPYAMMAYSVSGGVVDATEVRIDGTTVIDEDGNWVGPFSFDFDNFPVDSETNPGNGYGRTDDCLGVVAACDHDHDGDYVNSSQACATGEVVSGIDADGQITCVMDTAGAGDITGVFGGIGLTGGGTSGDITLDVDFGGTGDADTVARSDHHHDGEYAPADHGHDGQYPAIDQACAPGDLVAGIDAGGNVTCRPDDSVPVGTVIDWWRPDPSFPIPDCYAIADGSPVEDDRSPLFGQPLPDLTARFVMGVTNPANIGQLGGSPTHAHTVQVPGHAHSIDHGHGEVTVTVPGHSHGMDHDHPTSSTTTGGSSRIVTATGGDGTTGASSLTTTGTAGGGTTGNSSQSLTGGAGGGQTGEASSDITSTWSGDTETSSRATTGNAGDGVTGASSTSATSSAGSHNHHVLQYSGNDSRIWRYFNAAGSLYNLVNYSNDAGITLNTIGEDVIAPGVTTGVGNGDFNMYSAISGAHAHDMRHTHRGPLHGHDMGHTHPLPDHSHSLPHTHTDPVHAHWMAHTHNITSHDHAMAHTHAMPAHDHNMEHTHGLNVDVPDFAGSTTAVDPVQLNAEVPSYGGSSGAVPPATVTSSSDSNLPPYVGLLQLVRICNAPARTGGGIGDSQ